MLTDLVYQLLDFADVHFETIMVLIVLFIGAVSAVLIVTREEE